MLDNVLLILGAVVVAGLASWIHRHFYKRVPLFSLAPRGYVMETIQWLPDTEQETLLMNAQLGITRRQWRQIRARVSILIDKQLGIHKDVPAQLKR